MQNYSKTMALILAGALSVNGITVLAAESREDNLVVEDIKTTKIIKAVTSLGELSKQTVERGTSKKALNLPQTLKVETSLAGRKDITTIGSLEANNIENIDVTWEEVTPYDEEKVGTYIFKAVLPEGYTLAEDVSLPNIEVTVLENQDTDIVEVEPYYGEIKNSYQINTNKFFSRITFFALRNSSPFEGVDYSGQLTENQKKIYDALAQITPDTKSITVSLTLNVPEITSDALEKAVDNEDLTQTPIDALIKDYPEICWLKFGGDDGCQTMAEVVKDSEGNQKISSNEDGSYGMEVEFTVTTPIRDVYSKVDGFLQDMESVVGTVVSSINDTDSDYEKLVKFQEFLCNNASYKEGDYAHEAYGALITGECVCEGYAEAFKILCDKVGIPCVLVVGTGKSGEEEGPHMWNYVQLEGEWYAIDVTWNDLDAQGQSDEVRYDYFLVGQDTLCENQKFTETHIADGQFVPGGKRFEYPILSTQKYEVKEKEEGLPAPKVVFEKSTNTLKIANATIGKTYEVLVNNKKLYEVRAEANDVAINVNELIDCIGNEYVIHKGELKIRVAEDKVTRPGESWINTDDDFKFSPTFVGAEVPKRFVKGNKIPVTIIVDIPTTWEDTPAGEIIGSYKIVDNADKEIYSGELKEIGEWREYECDDETYELYDYNGNWCFEAEIEIPDNYVGEGKIIVQPHLAECERYNESINEEEPFKMPVEILEGTPVNVTLTSGQASKVTYGEDITMQAEVSIDTDIYNAQVAGKVQFILDGALGPIVEITGDQESGYKASNTWYKLACKDRPYEIQAKYIPNDPNEKIIGGNSEVLSTQVNPRVLIPSIDLSKVSSKEYDGTTNLKEGDIPLIILAGALEGEEPTAIADYELTGKEVGAQKVRATNIKLDNTKPVNKNYKLENDTVISEGTINIEKVETDKPSGGNQTDKPSGGDQTDKPSGGDQTNTPSQESQTTTHRSTSGGGSSSVTIIEKTTIITNINKILPSTVIVKQLDDKEISLIQKIVLENKNLSTLKGESLMMKLESKDSATNIEKPVLLKMNLSKVEITDPNKVTLVKYEKDTQGNVKVIKLGGSYNKETKEFEAYAEKEGVYDVIEDSQLLNINLAINSRILKVNGNEIISDIEPEIINDTIMVPLRFIAEKLGADIKWNKRNKKVTMTLDGQVITLKADKEAVLKNGRTLVPVRYISENLGAHVLWLEESQEVQIVK